MSTELDLNNIVQRNFLDARDRVYKRTKPLYKKLVQDIAKQVKKYVFIQDFPFGKDSSRYILQAYVKSF